MAYKTRLEAPSKSNRFYYRDNVFYQSGYGLPNCTCYAWGRFYEISGLRPKLCTRNAEMWWNYADGYERGQTPRLGAIICWSKGTVGNGKDGAGHVAVVEKINSDGSILVGQSGYSSKVMFWTTKLSKGYNLPGYKFQGFIYNPAVEVKKPPKVLFRCIVNASKGLIVRKGPGKTYAKTGYVDKNIICRIIALSDNKKWGKLYNGEGWINLGYTSKIIHRCRTTGAANMRKGPGTSNAKVGTLGKGVLCNIIEISEDGKWGKLAKNKRWISLSLTKKL